jgi:hypothetical protein
MYQIEFQPPDYDENIIIRREAGIEPTNPDQEERQVENNSSLELERE